MHKYHNQMLLSRENRKKQTEAEKLLWLHLRNKQLQAKFRRQQSIGSYIVDFVSLYDKLIIEIDGGQHNEPEVKDKDEARTTYLKSRGFKVLRFWNNDVLQNIKGVLMRIQEALA